MAGTLKVDSVQSSAANTPPVFKDSAGNEMGQLCKAWVNFNGSTAVIRSSFNVSSVTRSSTGEYTVNFTSALADANYSVGMSGDLTTGSVFIPYIGAAPATSSLRVSGRNGFTPAFDGTYISVQIFR